MAISPPEKRLWWKEPIERTEIIWITIALVWALFMFFMMPYWHIVGKQNLSNEAYRTTADQYAKKTEAFAAKYTVRKETNNEIPVVRPPAGSDVYMPLTRLGSAIMYSTITLRRSKSFPTVSGSSVSICPGWTA